VFVCVRMRARAIQALDGKRTCISLLVELNFNVIKFRKLNLENRN